MNRPPGVNYFDKKEDWHISKDDLLVYIDGELPADEIRKTQSHLQACWTCRVALEKIEKTIAAFVGYLNHELVATVAPPPLGWRTFRGRLDRVIAETEGLPRRFHGPDFLGRISSFWSPAVRLSLGALLIALVGISVILLSRASYLSANQLIQNAQEAQDQRTLAMPEPVIHQQIQIRREGTLAPRAVTWDIWNDIANHRFRQRAEEVQSPRLTDPRSAEVRQGRPQPPKRRAAPASPPQSGESTTLPAVLRELEEILRSNQINPASPLSAVNYESWRESVRRHREDVTRTHLPDGGNAFTLTTAAAGPFADNAIIRASLVIRADDWHPVAQQLDVQGEDGVREYQLTETVFEVAPLNHVDPAIFSDAFLSVAPSPPSRPAATSLARIPPTLTEAISAEIKARYALHRFGACVTESIEITIDSAGHVGVHGVTQTPERRQELVGALQGIPLLEANIETAAEVSLTGLAPPRSTTGPALMIGDSLARRGAAFQAQSSKLPIEDQLRDYFARRRGAASSTQAGDSADSMAVEMQIAELSKQAVSLSLAASAEAGAMRELANRYPPAEIRELDPVSRWLLEVMMRDHLASLRTETEQLRRLLTPVLSSVGGGNLRLAPRGNRGPTEEDNFADSDWAAATVLVFATVQHAERLTDYLFAGASPPPGEGDAVADLLGHLNQFPDGLERLEAQIDKDFLGRPDLLTKENDRKH